MHISPSQSDVQEWASKNAANHFERWEWILTFGLYLCILSLLQFAYNSNLHMHAPRTNNISNSLSARQLQTKNVYWMCSPTSSKQSKALDLALVFTTVLGLAFPNLTPVWLRGRGKAHLCGAMLGRTSSEDSASDIPQNPQRIPTWSSSVGLNCRIHGGGRTPVNHKQYWWSLTGL